MHRTQDQGRATRGKQKKLCGSPVHPVKVLPQDHQFPVLQEQAPKNLPSVPPIVPLPRQKDVQRLKEQLPQAAVNQQQPGHPAHPVLLLTARHLLPEEVVIHLLPEHGQIPHVK